MIDLISEYILEFHNMPRADYIARNANTKTKRVRQFFTYLKDKGVLLRNPENISDARIDWNAVPHHDS